MEKEWVRRREERRAMDDERQRYDAWDLRRRFDSWAEERERRIQLYADWLTDQERFVPDFWTSVWRAVAENRVEDLRQLLFESPELVDQRSGPDFTTPLMEAYRQGHGYTERLLLEFGADPDIRRFEHGRGFFTSRLVLDFVPDPFA